jgi:uncharacterized ferritin-like protein (DUF455 family)
VTIAARAVADGATLATLTGAAVAVLQAADPALKARLSRAAAEAWRRGEIGAVGTGAPPARPARPERPPLMAPRHVPRRRISAGPRGRIALLHALAHIELNAVDLAWDLIARFAGPEVPRAFADDWVKVAEEEAKHFGLLSRRLQELGARYGDLPAHDGLWQAAEATAHDLLARLAVVPLVLEARGLDVTPAMIAKLKAAGDEASAGILETIYQDEIGHVAIGRRWFEWLCETRGLAPARAWQDQVRRHFRGALKPPFNEAARAAAGFPTTTYIPPAAVEASEP